MVVMCSFACALLSLSILVMTIIARAHTTAAIAVALLS